MFVRKYEPIQPGDKYGKLTVVRKEFKPGVTSGNKYWLCVCECGETKLINEYQLRRGDSARCRSEAIKEMAAKSEKHGESNTRLYYTWMNMKRRCSKGSYYAKNYYDRGIRVCKAWRDSYVLFRDWALANGYSDDLTIDRIDNDSGYYPENCRWVTPKVQNRNKRSNVKIEMDGLCLTQSEWASIIGVKEETIRERLKQGLSVEEVLSPLHRKTGKKKGGDAVDKQATP